MNEKLAEERESLAFLVGALCVWAAHFLACYGIAAVFCAKLGPSRALDEVRLVIGGLTVAALAAIGAFGWRGWKRHRLAGGAVPHDDDTPEDRHRFLGYATAITAMLSGVSVAYSGMVALFFRTCR